MKRLCFILLFMSLISCAGSNVVDAPVKIQLTENHMKGMALTAPPKPLASPEKDMQALQSLGVNWVSIHPFGFFRKNQTEIIYNTDFQWWGEQPEGVAACVAYAHEHSLKTMLKPQLWSHAQWIGQLNFEGDTAKLKLWQESYRDFILPMAKLADSIKVELFCIATEIELLAQEDEAYWRELIQDIRKVYKGPLTYAANWDGFEKVPFWDALDYIGVDAYFPLCAHKTPTLKNLKKAWEDPLNRIEQLQEKHKKKVIFTEFGYLSVDGCAYKAWELESQRPQLAVNEEAQAIAVKALLEVFAPKDWWAGGFQWKWYLDNYAANIEGDPKTDYTPEGKQVEEVLKAYYK